MNKSLLNKTVVITGGSSGIGRSLAEGLLEEGARVGIISRRAPQHWEKPMPDTWNASENWIEADFETTENVQKNLKKWLSTITHIDVLIHCAVTYGSKSRHSFEETELTEWENLFAVNTKAPFIITKEVLPFMGKKSNGSIIGFVSDVVFIPGAGRIGYAASKSALHSLLISLAEEKKGTNISVTEILPKEQVRTPGIQKRRSTDHDFGNYASPDVFVKPIVSIINTTDDKFNGACVIVDKEGNFFKK